MNHCFTAVLLLVLGPGCVRNNIYRIAQFNPASDRNTVLAPVLAVYNVQFADANGNWHVVPSTARLIDPGKPIGFEKDDHGAIYAFANGERIPLTMTDAKALVWQGQMKEKTWLGKGCSEVVDGVEKSPVTGPLLAVAVGVGVGVGIWTGGGGGFAMGPGACSSYVPPERRRARADRPQARIW